MAQYFLLITFLIRTNKISQVFRTSPVSKSKESNQRSTENVFHFTDMFDLFKKQREYVSYDTLKHKKIDIFILVAFFASQAILIYSISQRHFLSQA